MSRLTTDPGLLVLGAACFAAAVAIAVLGSRFERRTRPRPAPRPTRQPAGPPTSACGFSIAAATRRGETAGDIAARMMRGGYGDDMALWPPRQEMPR